MTSRVYAGDDGCKNERMVVAGQRVVAGTGSLARLRCRRSCATVERKVNVASMLCSGRLERLLTETAQLTSRRRIQMITSSGRFGIESRRGCDLDRAFPLVVSWVDDNLQSSTLTQSILGNGSQARYQCRQHAVPRLRLQGRSQHL